MFTKRKNDSISKNGEDKPKAGLKEILILVFVGLLFSCAALYAVFWLMYWKPGYFKAFSEEEVASYLNENLPLNETTVDEVMTFINSHISGDEGCSELYHENSQLSCQFNASDASIIGSSYFYITFRFEHGILVEIQIGKGCTCV